MFSLDRDARISNAIGDCLLGLSHLYALIYIIRRERKKRCLSRRNTKYILMYWLVCIYLGTLLSFQLIGAYFHLFSPNPAEASMIWLIYLGAGCVSAMFYGAALSLDIFNSKIAVFCWLSFGFIYSFFFAPMSLDLARYISFLPQKFSLKLPGHFAHQYLQNMIWMPSALVFNQLNNLSLDQKNYLPPIILEFDGRGYAATPFHSVFDPKYADTFDLVAAFPCWRTDSLPFLMLCVGVIANTIHLFICIATRNRHPRARANITAHLLMFLALIFMPVAMFFGGVPLGIDLMHTCAAPGMFLQAQSCFTALTEHFDSTLDSTDYPKIEQRHSSTTEISQKKSSSFD
uniref:Uncharacterized protein n=1 Tax=Aureoumbra lagunensis TaxID=44058 RepID=A0A7S3NIM2_9STRA